jgi:hypothetical protein
VLPHRKFFVGCREARLDGLLRHLGNAGTSCDQQVALVHRPTFSIARARPAPSPPPPRPLEPGGAREQRPAHANGCQRVSHSADMVISAISSRWCSDSCSCRNAGSL